jgi:myosin heavy subunit
MCIIRRRGLGAEEPEQASATGRRSAFKLNSVGAQFRGQLKGLMATLTACQPHYVR